MSFKPFLLIDQIENCISTINKKCFKDTQIVTKLFGNNLAPNKLNKKYVFYSKWVKNKPWIAEYSIFSKSKFHAK